MKNIIHLSRLFILMLVTSSIIWSCRSGNDTEPEYYFRAKINGIQKNFLKSAKLQADIATWQHLILGGEEVDGGSTEPAFQIEIWNEGGTIKPGTFVYQTSGDSSDTNDYSVDGVYYYQTASGTVIFNCYETENFTFRITEISKEKGIKGTFSGTISSADFPGQIWTIENGEVYLPYNQMIN